MSASETDDAVFFQNKVSAAKQKLATAQCELAYMTLPADRCLYVSVTSAAPKSLWRRLFSHITDGYPLLVIDTFHGRGNRLMWQLHDQVWLTMKECSGADLIVAATLVDNLLIQARKAQACLRAELFPKE